MYLGMENTYRKPSASERDWLRLFKDQKRQAAQRNLEWELSFPEMQDLMRKRCTYCFQMPKLNTTNGITRNGIDRIDNKLGYIRGNVASCCWICNRAKMNMESYDFEAWLDETALLRSKHCKRFIFRDRASGAYLGIERVEPLDF